MTHIHYFQLLSCSPGPSPPPPPHSHRTRGYLCSFPITWTPLSREEDIQENTPYLGYWLPLAIKKKHPLFLLFSGNIPETIYFPCKIVLIYQECGDSTCRSHNEITRQRGQINTIGVGLLRTRNSGKFYTVCVIILHGVFCVRPKNTPPPLSRENGNKHAAPLCIRVGGPGNCSS